MNWVYNRVVRHKCVNYHLWSSQSDVDHTVYGLTRTSAIPPQDSAAYQSLAEVYWRTGVEIEPEVAGTVQSDWKAANLAVGIFRTEDGWAQVDYGTRSGPIPRDLYEEKGYLPAFEDLPTEADYRFQEADLKRVPS